MMVSLIILKFQSILAEGNRNSASLLVLPSLTTHYYAAVLSHLCSDMEMAFHPRWAPFHNAKKGLSKKLINYCQALRYNDGLRQKEERCRRERKKKKPLQKCGRVSSARPWEIFLESFWDQNSSVHDSSCPLYWSGLMACCFFLL